MISSPGVLLLPALIGRRNVMSPCREIMELD
jgi:hypothetical protein